MTKGTLCLVWQADYPEAKHLRVAKRQRKAKR